jgi:Domain of unknown function (DUF222)
MAAMDSTGVAQLLGRSSAEVGARALLDASGQPVTRSLKAVEQARRARLGAAVTPSGGRLFSDAVVSPPWADQAPGRELYDVVVGTAPAALGDYDLVELVRATGRLAAQVEALQVRAIAELARRPRYAECAGDPARRHRHRPVHAAADEVSAAMVWTPSFADGKVHDAIELVHNLTATLDALEAGRIDGYRARVIVEETSPLADQPDLRAAVEEKILARAGSRTGPQVRALTKKAVLAAAPEVAEQRRRKARRSRGVDKPAPGGDGVAQMGVTGPVEGLAAFWLAVDAAARHRHTRAAATTDDGNEIARADIGKTLEQLRFDVLADLGFTALHAQHLGCCNPDCGTHQRLGTRHGRAVHMNVTVPASTLAGSTDLPGEIRGFGPITAGTARVLAADAVWRRLLTDPVSGVLLDHGRTTYAPPQALRDHIIARDKTCRFTTCDIDADRADIDHTDEAAAGGPTSDANSGPLHRRHHSGKTLHAWRLRQDRPGHYLWISPTRHIYEVEPEAIGTTIVEFDQVRHPIPVEVGADPPPF